MWNKLPSSPGGETCACNSSFVVAVLCVAVCRVKTSTLLALTDPCSSNYNDDDEDAFQGNDDALKYPVAWPIYFLFAKLRRVGGTMHFTLFHGQFFLHCFFSCLYFAHYFNSGVMLQYILLFVFYNFVFLLFISPLLFGGLLFQTCFLPPWLLIGDRQKQFFCVTFAFIKNSLF